MTNIETMYYPQVDGITPTVINKKHLNSRGTDMFKGKSIWTFCFDKEKGDYRCRRCKSIVKIITPYCPYCGRRMKNVVYEDGIYETPAIFFEKEQ